MKIFKVLLLTLFGLSLVGCASAQTNKRQPTKKSEPKTTKPMNENPIGGELKILAEGSYGIVETPFIFVARSAETYAHLQKLVENLPPVAEIDFTRTAVVGAFAGTKNTGGYSVAVKKAAGKIRIDVVEPPKDAMTTDALTTPFTVSLVPIEAGKPLPLELSANWKNAVQTYKTTSGEFETNDVRRKKFSAEGTIGVLLFGDYATLIFDLSGKNADNNLRLTGTSSGVLKDGRIASARLDAGSFAGDSPSPLRVSGTLSNDKLSIFFDSFSSGVNGKLERRGKIEAAKVK